MKLLEVVKRLAERLLNAALGASSQAVTFGLGSFILATLISFLRTSSRKARRSSAKVTPA